MFLWALLFFKIKSISFRRNSGNSILKRVNAFLGVENKLFVIPTWRHCFTSNRENRIW